MKKIMFCLLTISLMGTMVMPVHAADVYADETTDLYFFTSKSHYPSGMYAVGKCGAVDKKTGKAYSQVIRIGVTPTGKVVR